MGFLEEEHGVSDLIQEHSEADSDWIKVVPDTAEILWQTRTERASWQLCPCFAVVK